MRQFAVGAIDWAAVELCALGVMLVPLLSIPPLSNSSFDYRLVYGGAALLGAFGAASTVVAAFMLRARSISGGDDWVGPARATIAALGVTALGPPIVVWTMSLATTGGIPPGVAGDVCVWIASLVNLVIAAWGYGVMLNARRAG